MTLAEIDSLSDEEIQTKFNELWLKNETLENELELQKNEADKYKGYYEGVKSDLEIEKDYNRSLDIRNSMLRSMIEAITKEL